MQHEILKTQRPPAANYYTPGHLGAQAISQQLDLHRNHSRAVLSMLHPLTYLLTLRPNSSINRHAISVFSTEYEIKIQVIILYI